jgi:hypothetical protein
MAAAATKGCDEFEPLALLTEANFAQRLRQAIPLRACRTPGYKRLKAQHFLKILKWE